MIRGIRPFVLLLLLLVAGVLRAQEPPTVYALLLYSPTCPHCHTFIDEELPKMEAEFGEQFVVIGVDVSTMNGQALGSAAFDYHNIPSNQRGVPTMLIGEEIFIGGSAIPTQAPDVVRQGLASGGIDVPPVPGLRESYNAARVAAGEAPLQAADTTAETVPLSSGQIISDSAHLANVAAVGVLIWLVISIIGVGYQQYISHSTWRGINAAAALFTVVLSALVGVSLVAKGETDLLANAAAWSAFALVIVSIGLVATQRENLVVPVLAIAGIIVGGYMSYIEIGQSSAVCGLIGDCNTVQQSSYAYLFGVIPIGVLGVLGYVAVLALWWVGRNNLSFAILLVGISMLGVLFSAYLTFLEPFVIQATCAWCLLSALIMVGILWASAQLTDIPQPEA